MRKEQGFLKGATPFIFLVSCKYIGIIIYVLSILSLVFVLSHAKLNETNEEIGFFSSFTQRKVELVAYIGLQKYQNSFPYGKNT